MARIWLYSMLLIAGLAGSQALHALFGEAYGSASAAVTYLTMTALAFIMIHVGYEFDVEKERLRGYAWDYAVAATAAAFPWVFSSAYFVLVMSPQAGWASWEGWKEALLVGRFASPTSAGILFSMLAAAGLSATWLYRKARVLAVFDDLDTILLMIPLKMAIAGLRWELGVVVVVIMALLYLAWRYMHRLRIPAGWQWVLLYSAALALASEAIYHISYSIEDVTPIHIEVLLPAFVLGCMIRRPAGKEGHAPKGREAMAGEKARVVISAFFMALVGLSMPEISSGGSASGGSGLDWLVTGAHVLAITVLSNLGKMFPAFCFRKEASFRERLALSIGMFPRGEVGAGVLAVSLSYGISGNAVTVAALSLALNLVLSGVFIYAVKRLIGR